MNAIVKEFPGQEGTFYRTNLPEPVPGPGQVKIKVMAASICASDIHALYNGLMADRYRYPVIIGHEGAGVVVEVGEGVEDIRVGDRVTAETTLTSCGTCEYCRKGETNNMVFRCPCVFFDTGLHICRLLLHEARKRHIQIGGGFIKLFTFPSQCFPLCLETAFLRLLALSCPVRIAVDHTPCVRFFFLIDCHYESFLSSPL